MKNVAIITPSLNKGGAERIAGLLSIGLSQQYNVFIFVHLEEELVYAYKGKMLSIPELQREKNLSVCEAIKKMKIDNDIDVSISFLGVYNYANIYSKGKDRIIISERNAQSRVRNRMHWLDRVTKEYYKYADAIVSCSEGVKYDLIANYGIDGRSIDTIYNYIDQRKIIEMGKGYLDKAVRDWLHGAEYFLNIGRLDPQKQQIRLIRQFEIFHKNDKRGIKLIIIGSGRLEKELKKIVKEDKLEEYVLILSYLSNPFPFLNRAECLILSSHYEGLPNVLIEAMAIGKPIIATDCLAGPRELLNDETEYNTFVRKITVCKRGILVPDADTDDLGETAFLADAMSWICSNPEKCKDFVKNQGLYMERYDNDSITKKWIQLIEDEHRKDCILQKDESNLLSSAGHLYIYGAGKFGRRLYERLIPEHKVDAFIVSDGQNIDKTDIRIPIIRLSEVDVTDEDTVIALGVSQLYADEIVKQLEDRCVRNLVMLGI